jgi:uncharacterized membrane protein YdjX (TVP38/TMEM64 family)
MFRINKKMLFFVIFIAVIIIIQFSPLRELVTIQNLKNFRMRLETAVRDNYFPSVLFFVVAYIVVTALSIPGATILTLAAGFLYGPLLATVYVNIGATAGAVIAFLAVRHLFGNWMQHGYQRQLERFNEEMKKNGTSYLLTLRFIPAFPFFLINILSGLTRVSARTFAWTTSVGIIPGTAAYAYAGRQIVSLNSLADILSARLIAAFAVLAVLAIFPALRNRFRSAKNSL